MKVGVDEYINVKMSLVGGDTNKGKKFNSTEIKELEDGLLNLDRSPNSKNIFF